MKIPDNRVASIAPYFHLQLDELYPKQEVDSFVFLSFSALHNYSRTDLHLNKDNRLSESELLDFIRIVKRLKQFEPIQYILGETEFYGLKFKVDKRVLIPRPETEELVDWILKSEPKADSILDIGTGSGCIPISLKKNMPQANISAVDISLGALAVAEENANLNEVAITFHQTDILNVGETDKLGVFNLVVSNPPYVLEGEKAQMQSNVLDYEPEIALFVKDNDPLLFYRGILDFSQKHLKQDGSIYFEINEAMGELMVELCKEKGFANCELRQDLRKKFRMLKCKRE